MSQFDFPRINFQGKVTINPSTGNNSFFQPLTFYDPVQVEAFIPPRLYILDSCMVDGKTIEDLKKLLPEDSKILKDKNGKSYILIEPISNLQIFKKWATTPLGSFRADLSFHPIYKVVKGLKSGTTLHGTHPGYWNYYGDMTFSFNEVYTTAVEVYEKRKIHQYHKNSRSIPDDISKFVDARLQMFDNTGRDIGIMIDTLPTMAIYTQVFCDKLILSKEDTILMSGSPCKASVRNLNMQRIINQPNILGASGTFYSTIDFNEHPEHFESEIAHLFNKAENHGKKLQGVFIRYNIYEVAEDQSPDYEKIGFGSNPAHATITGSLSPWYEGEMRSMSMARLLLSEKPYLPGKGLNQILCTVNTHNHTISLDLLASIPEINLSLNNSDGNKSISQDYLVVDIGEIQLKFIEEGGDIYDIDSFNISHKTFNKEKIALNAGIVDLSYAEIPGLKKHDFLNGYFYLEGMGITKTENEERADRVILSKECKYVFGSDQAGIYSNQFDNPSEGYRSYSEKKEACTIRIFAKGKPVDTSIPVLVFAYRVTSDNPEFSLSDILKNQNGRIKDGDTLLLNTEVASNTIFYFMEEKIPLFSSNLLSEFSRTGFFINHRVLPKHNYEKYLDPDKDEYNSQIPYEVIMSEIFLLYELVYPVSAEISPFDPETIRRAIPALLRLMSPSNWASSTYMPSTRELSCDQYDLFCKWASQQSKG